MSIDLETFEKRLLDVTFEGKLDSIKYKLENLLSKFGDFNMVKVNIKTTFDKINLILDRVMENSTVNKDRLFYVSVEIYSVLSNIDKFDFDVFFNTGTTKVGITPKSFNYNGAIFLYEKPKIGTIQLPKGQ